MKQGIGGNMRRKIEQWRFLAMVLAGLFGVPRLLAQGPVTINGSLPDGATYVIEVPPKWNGTLFLYSHGYVPPIPGTPNPAQDFAVADPLTHDFMLSSGFALAGSSYAHQGWAVQEALVDQIAVLDLFNQKVGQPKRTIAWGHSLGGMITAGLIQRNPGRFDAALPMCGVLSGGVATWNTALDSTFAFQNLIPGGPGLQLVNITDPAGNLALAETVLAEAQATPQGRARLALAAALGDLPGWFDPASPEPAAADFVTQEANQFQWDAQVDFPFAFAFRAELEFRASGNPSSNVGVDYRKQLARSVDAVEVRALYDKTGLDLETDLNTINQAQRISADPGAREYLEQNIIYDGDINIPVLTLHTIGDGLVVVENESAYRQVVREDGNQALLRRTFVSRAGHCAFTPAETIAAAKSLLLRLDTGKWPDLGASDLNATAASLGPLLNMFVNPTTGRLVSTPAALVDFHPAQYLRPFDGEAEECETGHFCRDLASLFRSH
jgi:pimeloyl-ACP methyl ester carboxylesterase